jgi:hypothetical protein
MGTISIIFLKKLTNSEKNFTIEDCVSYKTYEEMSVRVLKETDNQVFSLCMEFIKAHAKLSQNN